MDTRRIEVYIFLILCTGCLPVHSQTDSLTVASTPSPAILGSNPFVVKASYTTSQFRKIYLVSSGAVSTVEYAGFLSSDSGTSAWLGDAPTELKSRATVNGSKALQFLEIRFPETKCEDAGAQYFFKLNTGTADNEVKQTKDITIAVEAAPLAPVMSEPPNSQNVTEGDELTFTCEGNVGRPRGSFQWFTFNNNEESSMTNVTDKAVSSNAIPAPGDRSCTFTLSSELKLKVTRLQQGKRLVVRCRVYHPTQGNDNVLACQDPATDFCRMSSEIDVQFPVSVTVSGDKDIELVEGTDKSITCFTEGNPKANSVEWRKENDNTTLTTENILTLTNVTFAHTGNYICTAYNTIGGITHQASDTVSVTVVEKTTVPPTTTTPETSTTPGGNGNGPSGPNTAGGSDNLKIIIPVVVIAVVIVIIIVVVIVLRRRNKAKQIEEPKEKAFNNHAGINPMSSRPDLVRNDKAFGGYDNTNMQKNEDGLAYAELQFDNKPRSRRPLAIDDSHTDYSDVSMPQV